MDSFAQGKTVRLIRISSEVHLIPMRVIFITYYIVPNLRNSNLWPAISKRTVFRVNNNENTSNILSKWCHVELLPLPAPDSIRCGSPLLADPTGMESKTRGWAKLYATMLYGYTEAEPLQDPLLVGAGGFSWDDSVWIKVRKYINPG